MSQQTSARRQSAARKAESLLNRFMIGLLRSPLHGLMSSNVLIISFTGHKTGKPYATPITYLREGNTFTAFTESRWWKNFQTPAPVSLWVQGKELSATATAIADPQLVTKTTQHYLEIKGYNRAYLIGVTGLPRNRIPTFDEVAKVMEGTVVIHMELQA